MTTRRRARGTAGWRELVLIPPSIAIAFVLLELLLRFMLGPAAMEDLPRPFVDEDALARELWMARRQGAVVLDRYAFDMPDQLLGWRPRPGAVVRAARPGVYDVAVHIDDHGLRAPGPSAVSKAPGVVRVGVYGCSQTFGEGVADEDTFSARLAALLPGTEVLNFGVHGYGTDQMLLAYERDAAPYDLDVVVVAFAWFHVQRNWRRFGFFAKPRFELEPDGTLVLTGTPVPDPEAVLATSRPEEPRWWDGSLLLRWAWRRVLNERERRALRPDAPEWALSRALLARFVRKAHERGAVAVLASIDESRPDLEPALAQLAADEGAAFVDIGPRLRQMSRAGVAYRLEGDGHWNAAGHRAIAAELARTLCRVTPRVPCPVEEASGHGTAGRYAAVPQGTGSTESRVGGAGAPVEPPPTSSAPMSHAAP
jgi:hypothetical protein